jgi:predicted  nucleic acid-binding Zn-ribbon protein
MYVALGFCTAGLIGLAILPAFYRRAARLTEEALRAVNPASYAEVRAAQDQERARYAVELRRVETRLDAEREKAARFHIEASRLTSQIEQVKATSQSLVAELETKLADQASDQHAVDMLSAEIKTLKQKLSESEKALAESWTTPRDKAPGETQASDTKADGNSDWLPATDTMTLATITGLEAEVATLKSRLAAYEPTVAGEVEASIKEASRSRLAELEAQLVDTESNYVSAQAEVTRLSLMLEAANAADAEPDKKLQAQLKELTRKIASQQTDLKDRDRALQRLTGQVRQLRSDLAASPELKGLREEFRALSRRLSDTETISVAPEAAPASKEKKPVRGPAKAATPAPDTTERAVNGNRPQAAGSTASKPNGGEVPEVTASPSQETPQPPSSARSSDIASAAEALVSRIVASSRNKTKTEADSTASPASGGQETAGKSDTGSGRKTKSAKQKNKDVA